MSDLVGNPEDRFSHVTAHIVVEFMSMSIYISLESYLLVNRIDPDVMPKMWHPNRAILFTKRNFIEK